ncbi:Elongation factor Ts, mitochondrial [Rhizoclosmatium sp. JEL0117]|nr:Elongation factor Ts, mitochondrial [Rhizoclosmatium sp. JEL0117]
MLLRRLFSTATTKPSLAQLVAQLRKETSAPIGKARAALESANGDFAVALESLRRAAEKTSEKVAHRTAKQGLAAVWLGAGNATAAIVEVNCETDFVERGDLFKSAVKDIRSALDSAVPAAAAGVEAGLIREVSSEDVGKWLESATLSGSDVTVKQRTVDAIAKVGENIRVRRIFVSDVANSDASIRYGGYTHGGSDLMGKIAALVALRVSPVSSESSPLIDKLARQLAQQVVGFSPSVISDAQLSKEDATKSGDELEALVLERQQFLAGGGTVRLVLDEFKAANKLETLEVVEFKRVVCGEGIEVKESNFAEEVMQQAGLKP